MHVQSETLRSTTWTTIWKAISHGKCRLMALNCEFFFDNNTMSHLHPNVARINSALQTPELADSIYEKIMSVDTYECRDSRLVPTYWLANSWSVVYIALNWEKLLHTYKIAMKSCCSFSICMPLGFLLCSLMFVCEIFVLETSSSTVIEDLQRYHFLSVHAGICAVQSSLIAILFFLRRRRKKHLPTALLTE